MFPMLLLPRTPTAALPRSCHRKVDPHRTAIQLSRCREKPFTTLLPQEKDKTKPGSQFFQTAPVSGRHGGHVSRQVLHQEKVLRLAGVCISHYLPLAPRVLVVLHREVAKRQFALLPHGSFTPTVVLTEPPPLLDPVSRAVAGREYHYHPDCHGHTGSNPVLEQVISLASRGRVVAYQTP